MPIFSDFKASLNALFGNSTAETPTSHTRPDNINSDILLLPDGRKLGYAQCGSPTGRAILFAHGHPGSRLDAAHLHEAGLKVGARIIGVDRPGMGLSSPHPDRTVLDYPKDLEHVADHLKLERYGVLVRAGWLLPEHLRDRAANNQLWQQGVSGGGPYALACAFALPSERLKCVSIVCGLGPVSEIGMKGARWVNWIGFSGAYHYCPRILNRWFWQSQPGGRLDLSEDQRLERHMKAFLNPKSTAEKKDAEVMTDEVSARRFLQSNAEAFAQGYDATLQDGRLLSSDFGFRIQDIRPDLPVQLWYGKQDVCVPLNHGETIATRLGDRAPLRVEDETHASIFFKWREQILEEMVKKI